MFSKICLVRSCIQISRMTAQGRDRTTLMYLRPLTSAYSDLHGKNDRPWRALHFFVARGTNLCRPSPPHHSFALLCAKPLPGKSDASVVGISFREILSVTPSRKVKFSCLVVLAWRVETITTIPLVPPCVAQKIFKIDFCKPRNTQLALTRSQNVTYLSCKRGFPCRQHLY